MGITAYEGPLLTFGITVTSTGGTSQYNDQRAPSAFDLGAGLADPRAQYGYGYTPGQAVSSPVMMFYDNRGIIDQVPSAASSNGIALTQTATGNGALTLNTTSANLTLASNFTAPETGTTPSGTLYAIDGLCGGTTNAGVQFGQSATVQCWNPTSMISRCLAITSSQNDASGAYTISGRDVYGFLMTETITGPNNSTVTTQKAFKYIYSSGITSSGTIASTGVYIGVADKYGFPMRVDSAGWATVWYGQTSSMALGGGSTAVGTATSTGFTYASTRATQTSSTPDVRGTITVTPASTGGQRLFISVLPTPTNLATLTSTNMSGIFGAPQA